MFKFEQLKQIHLEITNNCQASCPMCTRNIHGGVENPLLKISSWTLEQYKTIMSADVLKTIELIYFCGNYGDPLLNNDLIDMVRYSVEVNPSLHIRIHTNGSLRSKAWWKELAEVMPKQHGVVFAIDGLEDTHSIYRVGTSYSKIIENAKAFIDAGGEAEWAYIRFKHNETQVEEAKQIAQDLGFKQFVMKDSSRFLFDAKFPVYDKDKNVVNHLEPSQWSELKFIDKKIIDNYKSILAGTTIDCMALRLKEIYIDTQGHVFPCCWLAMTPYQAPDEITDLYSVRQSILAQYYELVDSLGGIESLSALNKPVADIINSAEYQTVWDNYWTKNKLITCGRSCGVLPEVFSTPHNQFISTDNL